MYSLIDIYVKTDISQLTFQKNLLHILYMFSIFYPLK